MSRAARAAGTLFAGLVILFTAAAAVYGVATDGRLLAAEMLRHAPPEATGLPEAEYPGVGVMTASFLAGEEPDFQYVFEAAGGTYQCFLPHEAAHMADCRRLIRLAGTLCWVAGGAVLALAAGMLPRKSRRDFVRGALCGLRMTGALGAALLLWGAVDFDGLFTAFHRLAFPNGGWLLDPRTDLLIRLMPTAFFTDLAVRILLYMLAAGILAGLAARITLRFGIAAADRTP